MSGAVGLVGLGIMGSAMANNLLSRNFDVLGIDLVTDRVTALEQRGGKTVATYRELAEATDVVITSLERPEALAEVVGGDHGLRAGAHEGLVVVETSTFPLETKEQARADLATAGVALLDCTVSGTGTQAIDGDIAIYGSGDAGAFQRAQGPLEAVARSVHHLGEFGLGTKMKLVANLLVAIHNLATAEAVLFGQRAGLDPRDLIEVIGDGAGTSRIFELRGPFMAEGQYEPAMAALTTLAKDVKIIDEHARKVGAPTPLLSAATPFYTAAIAQGLGEQDAAALHAVLSGMTGDAESSA
jgi:3-hydroxyisobutyrate dehydrogenase-like beta-hydroxyacid dehydrogenase